MTRLTYRALDDVAGWLKRDNAQLRRIIWQHEAAERARRAMADELAALSS
jgi:hypothetical protein